MLPGAILLLEDKFHLLGLLFVVARSDRTALGASYFYSYPLY